VERSPLPVNGARPEERPRAALRVVLDTNVLVSALLYRDGELAWLWDAWRSGCVVPLADEGVLEELRRILTRLGGRKFDLEPEQVLAIVETYRRLTEAVPADPQAGVDMPKCKDADDQKFLDLACRGQAAALVTSDAALLALARRTPFSILPPIRFRQYVQLHQGG